MLFLLVKEGSIRKSKISSILEQIGVAVNIFIGTGIRQAL